MSKYLVTTVETYRVDTESNVKELIEKAKKAPGFTLTKYTSEYKEVKQKGEVIDDYYKVSLTKAFNNIKDPDVEIDIKYKRADLMFDEEEE